MPQAPAGTWSSLALATVAALAASAAGSAWEIFVDLHRAAAIDNALRTHRDADIATVRSADHAVHLAAVIDLALVVVTATLFIAWLYRTCRAVASYSPDALRHGPGWAIGGWFVPFLNLVRPKQMVDDAWASATVPHERPPLYLHVWWAALLASSLMARVASAGSSASATDLADADRLRVWADGLDLIAAGLAIVVVLATTRRVMAMRAVGGPKLLYGSGRATGADSRLWEGRMPPERRVDAPSTANHRLQ